jgi:hypothetical protein
VLEDFVDLVLKTAGKHLICLIEAEDLHTVGAKSASVDHIEDTAWGTDDDMAALLELLHVLAYICATNTSVAFDVHIVAEGDDDLLNLLCKFAGWGEDERLGSFDRHVQSLENGNGKGRSLAGARLGLCDHVVALDYGDDGSLLNRRGALETGGMVRSRSNTGGHGHTRKHKCHGATLA